MAPGKVSVQLDAKSPPASFPVPCCLISSFFFPAPRAQGSADYSEYGYEPEYELQGDEKLDADAETLAKWRLEKLLANDRWQFGKYGTQTVGNWIGERRRSYCCMRVFVVGVALLDICFILMRTKCPPNFCAESLRIPPGPVPMTERDRHPLCHGNKHGEMLIAMLFKYCA